MQQHAAVRAGDGARRTGDPVLRGKSVTGYRDSGTVQVPAARNSKKIVTI